MNKIEELKEQRKTLTAGLNDLYAQQEKLERKEASDRNTAKHRRDQRQVNSRIGRLEASLRRVEADMKALGVEVDITAEDPVTVTVDAPTTTVTMGAPEDVPPPAEEEFPLAEEEFPLAEEEFPPPPEEEFPPEMPAPAKTEETPKEEEKMAAVQPKQVKVGAYTATLRVAKTPAQTAWTVTQANQPVLRVTAEQAYGSLLEEPYTDTAGHTHPDYPTHYAAFASEQYGRDVCAYIAQVGLAKVAAEVRGEVLAPPKQAASKCEKCGCAMKDGKCPECSKKEKEAATHRAAEECPECGLATMVDGVCTNKRCEGYKSRCVDNEAAAPSGLPKQALGESDLPEESQHPVEMANAGPPFEPSPEGLEQMTEEPEEKLAVTDLLIDLLAPMVVNDAYSTEEIMTDLKTTFADDDLSSTFEGALQERVDYLSEEVSEEPEETSPAEIPSEELPAEIPPEEMVPPAELQGAPTPALKKGEAEIVALQQKIAQLEQEKGQLEKDQDLKYRTHLASQLVDRMIAQGLLDTAADIEALGYPPVEAQARARKLHQARKAEIAGMEKVAFNQFVRQTEGVLQRLSRSVPVAPTTGHLATDSGTKEFLAKQAAELPPQEMVPAALEEAVFQKGFWTPSKRQKMKTG